MKRIQIAPHHIVKDVETVWHEHGPEVDMVMDPKHLTFAPNSLDALYSFHVLDHLFLDEISVAIQNWRACLKPGGELFIVVDDFETLARQFVGGDILIGQLNERYTHPVQFTRDNLIEYVSAAGFGDGSIKIWFADVPELFTRRETELVISGQKV